MKINNSTRYQYREVGMKQSAELSVNKLAVLLSILAVIWVLCYNAEIQFPARHIADTYARMGSNNVTQESYQYAINFIKNNTEPGTEHEHRVYLTNKYNLTKSPEKDICVILIHTPDYEKWMSSVQSLLAQNYSKFKVYYLNNYQGGQQIYKYIETNAIQKRKFKVIQNIQDNDYTKQLQSSKNYCQPNDLVVYMHDDDQLVGQDVFVFLNAMFSKDTRLQLLYSASLIQRNKGKSRKPYYRLGKSYPYPPQIIQQKQYRKYTYLIDGLLVFNSPLLKNVLMTDILDDNNLPYQYTGQIALGIDLLELAGSNIVYVPQILLLRSRERTYIAIDDQMKKQMLDISNDQ